MSSNIAFGSVFRVGHLPNPWLWTDWRYAEDNGRFGGRWDDSEGSFRVVYAGATLFACFVELLAKFRPDPGLITKLDDIVEDGVDALEFPVVGPGVLAGAWTAGRAVGEARFVGRVFDPTTAEGIAELRPHFLAQARSLGCDDFDAAALKDGRARALTQSVSTYVHLHKQVDALMFRSRLGDELELLAIYERPGDDPVSTSLSDQRVRPLAGEDPELTSAMRFLGLRWG